MTRQSVGIGSAVCLLALLPAFDAGAVELPFARPGCGK